MVELEVHRNQQVVSRGPKVALVHPGQAGFTAGTRGCHDEVAYPPHGRHIGAGVVVLLLDGGIGTCRQSAGLRESFGELGHHEVHNSQRRSWHPAVAGRTHPACGPSVGPCLAFLPAGLTAARTCRRGPHALARRVRACGLGVGPHHRQRSYIGRHAWQCRGEERDGRHGHRPACRTDGLVSDRLAPGADHAGIEHTALRRISGILRTAFLNRSAKSSVAASPARAAWLRSTTACRIHCHVDRLPAYRDYRACRAYRACPACRADRADRRDVGARLCIALRPDAFPAASAQAARVVHSGRTTLDESLSLVLASPRSMRLGLTRSSSVAFPQDMPAAGMPFRSGAPL